MFKQIISELLTLKKDKNNSEFEIRFGSFNQKNHFESNVDVAFFYRLKKTLKIQNNNENHKYNHLVDTFYKVNNDNVRETKNETDREKNNVKVIKKQYIKYHNDVDYDIRFSVSCENDYKNDYKSGKKTLIRNKERHTYFFNCGNIDLTRVTEHNLEYNKKNIKYEVEFEINQNSDINSVDSINNILQYILQVKYDNYYIISNTEKQAVLDEYRKLVKQNYFVGAQPETLQRENLNIFYNDAYSVTQKVDGERFFMFITSNSDIYLLDSNLKVLKTQLKSRGPGPALIDGELTRNNNIIHFMAFDLLLFFDSYNIIDVRGNDKYNLITRVNIISQILNDCYQESNLYKFSCKEYIWKNVFMGSDIILNNINPADGFDGLIFTPINDPYPLTKKWSKLLKWKPKELNTIDFYSILNKNQEWELYVQNINEQKKIELVLFNVNERFESFNEKSELITFKTTFDKHLIDPTTLEYFKSHTVIEYKWDYNTKKFVPLRTRWDKTVNPSKRGNFSSVAYSIWNNIMNPVERELLFKLKNLNVKDDIYFKNMRRLHNKMKEMLFNNYTKNSERHLELCVGKGFDIQKWIYNNIKYVCGYDLSEKNIAKCNEKYKSNNGNSTKCIFNKLDLSKDNASCIIKEQNEQLFTTMSCHFSIQYFLQSQNTFDNFIKILDYNLHNNGVFIISYLDSSKLTNKNLNYKLHDGNIVYLIKSDTKKTCQFGEKIKIYLDGNLLHDYNDEIDEYIVNSSFIISYMESKGYTCIENKPFSNQNTFNEYEAEINSLYVYNVFKKQEKTNVLEIQTNSVKELEVYKNDNKESKFIQIDDNLSLLKISNTLDIVKMLNCENYTINEKNSVSKTISSVDDIKEFLESYDINNISLNNMDLNNVDLDLLKNYLYIYTNTNVQVENEIEVTYTNYYIVLYKYKFFFNYDKNYFVKLNITEVKNEETPQKLIQEPTKELETLVSQLSITEKQPIEQSIEQPIEQPVEKQIENEENLVSASLKTTLLTTLNNKITLKILKESILLINQTLNKNIKTTGSKEVLIERVNEVLQTL
jgi:hypothetical protein